MFAVQFHQPNIGPAYQYLFPRKDGSSSPTSYGPIYPYATQADAEAAKAYLPKDAEDVMILEGPAEPPKES